MFKLFKDRNKNNTQSDNNFFISYSNFKKELESKFDSFDSFSFNDMFFFILKQVKNTRDTLIVAAYLSQIDIPLEEVLQKYNVNNEYAEEIINKWLPILRVNANKIINENKDKDYLFFPGIKVYVGNYEEFVDRIELLFELKRNIKKINKDSFDKKIYNKLSTNYAFLFLLNYLSTEDALLLGSSLDILNLYYDYECDNNSLMNIIDRVDLVELNSRIKKLCDMDFDLSYFDYDTLLDEYSDLSRSINETIEYLSTRKR